MKALITGATGFVGRRLVAKLPGCVVLTRDASRAKAVLGDVNAYPWDASRERPPLCTVGVMLTGRKCATQSISSEYEECSE